MRTVGGLGFRVLGDDELAAAQIVADRASGVRLPDAGLARVLAHGEPGRWYGAFDGPELVGATRNVACRLVLPGWRHLGPLPEVPVANATWTGVLPTHRRRGILREMQRWHMADARGRDEVALIGTPSQSTIYGRFGHGPVAALQAVRIETRGAGFARPVTGPVALRQADSAAGFEAMRGVYERYRAGQPGEVTRSPAIWDFVRADGGPGEPPLFWVLCRPAGGSDEGYVGYQIVERPGNDRAERILRLRELVATTPAAHAALWRFCLDLDLVTAVEGWIPCHDPVRWLLADQRRLEVRGQADRVWMRPVDPLAMLRARGYSAPGTITLNLVDDFLPENAGSYTITAGDGGAAVVRRAGDPGDLTLGAGQLATLLLGASQFATLAAAGLVQEHAAGAIHRADAMFTAVPPPACISPI